MVHGATLPRQSFSISKPSTRATPNCLQTAVQSVHAESRIMFITVNTLQAIFQRLVEDGFCNLAPSIIVTAKGMPDLSTRVFLRQLHEAFPQLPVLGLVDWNPSGKS